MSQENVEIVRASWDAWLRGDMDGLFAGYDPDIVWDLTHYPDWPESTYHGHEGVRRFMSEWLEVWDSYEGGVEEFLPAADGRVVSLAWQRGKGRQSGLVMNMKWAQVFTVRDGKIVRINNYEDRSEALEAVGLRE